MNPDLQIGAPREIRGSAILTGSYVASIVFSMANHNAIGLTVDVTIGSLTYVGVKVEISNDGGSTYSQEVGENTSSGTVTVSLAERRFGASGVYSILVHPVRGKLVKVSAIGNGTVTNSLLAIDAVPLWV